MQFFQKELETMSPDQKKVLQSERLRKMVKYVYENQKPYRAKMDAIKLKPEDIKSIDDIYKLPYTVKQDLRDAYPFGMMARPRKDLVRLHASSATTGKLTVAGYTMHDIDVWAECAARSLVMAGADEDSIVHIAYGYGLFTGGLGMHYGAEKMGACVTPASAGNTQKQIQLICDFGADIICCTPSYIIYLAEEIEKMGLKIGTDIKLKGGVFGAEAWSEGMREDIERRLGLRACDIYGLSEIAGPGVACDCKYYTGLHICDDHFYPEIIDPKTLQPVADGEVGELVFTTLTKEGIPLIRYRTKDLTSITHEVCECGRTSPRISRFRGRSDDMLIIRGVNVFPSQVEAALIDVEEVTPHYMMIVDRIDNHDTLEIQVEIDVKYYTDEIKGIEKLTKKISGVIQQALGISAKIKLMGPNTLKRSEGKAVHVIDNRKLY